MTLSVPYETGFFIIPPLNSVIENHLSFETWNFLAYASQKQIVLYFQNTYFMTFILSASTLNEDI